MDDNTAEELAIRSRYKQMPCRHCGKPITVSVRTRKSPSHIECSIDATIEAARQMREKSGPYYDKWRDSMFKAFEREAGGGGPADTREG